MDDVVLGHVAEHAAERREVGVQVDAVEAHRPRARGGDPGDRVQQRGLAGAARTDDGDELTRRDRQRHRIEERQLASVTDPDPPGQVVDVDAHTPRRGATRRGGLVPVQRCLQHGPSPVAIEKKHDRSY